MFVICICILFLGIFLVGVCFCHDGKGQCSLPGMSHAGYWGGGAGNEKAGQINTSKPFSSHAWDIIIYVCYCQDHQYTYFEIFRNKKIQFLSLLPHKCSICFLPGWVDMWQHLFCHWQATSPWSALRPPSTSWWRWTTITMYSTWTRTERMTWMRPKWWILRPWKARRQKIQKLSSKPMQ